MAEPQTIDSCPDEEYVSLFTPKDDGEWDVVIGVAHIEETGTKQFYLYKHGAVYVNPLYFPPTHWSPRPTPPSVII